MSQKRYRLYHLNDTDVLIVLKSYAVHLLQQKSYSHTTPAVPARIGQKHYTV